MDKREENLLYQKIGTKSESCEQLKQKHNYHNSKTIHQHIYIYIYIYIFKSNQQSRSKRPKKKISKL